MLKNISKKKLKKILKQNVEIPEKVNERIQCTYVGLGIRTKEPLRYTKKHRMSVAVVLVTIFVIGLSVCTYAAAKFLSAELVEKEDKMTYNIQVDTVQEAHEIQVEATYLPKGYVFGDETSIYRGKWHNADTDSTITVIPYNAAQLDKMKRTNNLEFMSYLKDSYVEKLEISGMKTDVFVNDDSYTDSENTVKNLYLFNEEYGYGIQISSHDTLSTEELIKVAKGLEITVLDTVVPYATDEEIAQEIAAQNASKKTESMHESTRVPKDNIFAIGQEIKNPFLDIPEMAEVLDDIRYTVINVEIQDSLSAEEYPTENYIDYENQISPWINSDGTLKTHDRYRYDSFDASTNQGILEKDVASKYVVVKMKAQNYRDVENGFNRTTGTMLSPELTCLTPESDGTYSYPTTHFSPGNKNYTLQWGGYNGNSLAIYFDKIYYAEGIGHQKQGLYRSLEVGEALEYTLVYIVDEDQLNNLYLSFYSGTYPTDKTVIQPYVKIR